MNELKTTILTNDHLELKAKMAPFAGYNMPIQYSSVKEETLAVRNNVGVFDVSHMGEFFVEGEQTIDFIDHLIPNDYKNLSIGKAIYSPLLREDATIIDDLITYKLSENKAMICVNAANIEKDWNWISAQASNFNIKLTNHSDEISLLAVQGPKAEQSLNSLGLEVSDVPTFGVKSFENGIILARTGYTGEDGFEVFCPNEKVKELWSNLLSNGVIPCGLAARDVLRLEVCYPLYGHELNDELTPFDTGLKWTTKMNKQDFIGKKTLETYNPKFKLIKLALDKGIPREGYDVLNSNGDIIGKVTSGTMSVTLNKGIALALIDSQKVPNDENYLIKIRKNNYPAIYLKKPFVVGGNKK
ncbi:MAG: glycine cleavage system aminomethyltransferase GcvT [Bacteriovoracaceae bacterium]